MMGKLRSLKDTFIAWGRIEEDESLPTVRLVPAEKVREGRFDYFVGYRHIHSPTSWVRSCSPSQCRDRLFALGWSMMLDSMVPPEEVMKALRQFEEVRGVTAALDALYADCIHDEA
jgi:hypothetical protein